MANATKIIYVNQIAVGAQDGGSWVNAYTDLQTALAKAQAGDQIWVAKGVYKPTTKSDDEARKKSFVLVEGVAIYGGFSGDELKLTDRDWNINKTILSGDIGKADDGSDNSYHVVYGKGLSSATVLDGFTITSGNASGDHDLGRGGGLLCDGAGQGNQCNPTLCNLIFCSNNASYGGAIWNYGDNSGTSSPILINVIFFGNKAKYQGGGMYNSGQSRGTSNPTLINVTFSGNTAGNFGGAISNNGTGGTSKPVLANSIFWNNTAGSTPDEIYSHFASPTISYSIIKGGVNSNKGAVNGGHNLANDPRFVGPIDPGKGPSTASGLRLQFGSPALDIGNPNIVPTSVTAGMGGKPRVRNNTVNIGAYEGCIIFVNQAAKQAKPDGSGWEKGFIDLNQALKVAKAGDEIWVAKGTYKPTSASGDEARKRSFELKDMVEIYGGFTGTETCREARDWHANKTILSGDIGANDEMKDNSYHVVTGKNLSKETILDGFTIAKGYADGEGNLSSGGGLYLSAGSPTLRNLIICGNQARLDGGGLYNEGASPTLINVVLSGNRAHSGGALYNNGKKGDSSPTLINVTISGNRADSRGGGLYNNGENGASKPTLTNVILWGNSASLQRDKGYDSHEVYNYYASVTVSYSMVQGGIARIKDAKDAGNNLSLADGVYPRFGKPVHPAKAPTAKGDLRLQAGSPAINCGNNKALPRGLACDLSGRPRVIKDTVDIGAYEAPTIVYVNQAAAGAIKDGSSWATAYADLQRALERASVGDEIWVAKGVYKPTTESGNEARKKSFVLVEGVEIYGGFDGTETRRDQRDWNAYQTTLSGALGKNGDNSDNSYHVITGKGLTDATVLDGFTITDGNANGEDYSWRSGGGLYCNGSGSGTQCSPTLRNLTFSDNYAKYGGAIYNDGTSGGVSSPMLTNVTFSRNTSDQSGGAIYNGGSNGTSSPTLTNVIFSDNTSKNSDGGAIYNDSTQNGVCSPTLTDVIFSGNKAASEGGAIYNDGSKNGTCSPTLTNVTFKNNSAAGDSNNAPTYNDNASPKTLSSPVGQSSIKYVNAAASGGGKDGSSWVNAYIDLQDALKNAKAGNEIWVVAGEYKPGSGRTASFALKEGVKLYGGFIGTETDRDQRDWTTNKTMLSGAGNSYHVVTADRLTSATVLDGFLIAGGNANGDGDNSSGGGLYCRGGSPTLRNLVFSSNKANKGGGLFWDGAGGTSSPRLTDVIFSGNNAENGGGLYCNGAGGESRPVMTSVILWNNSATTGHEIYSTNASPTISCSIIQGGIKGNRTYTDEKSSIIDLGCNSSEDPFFIKPVDLGTAPTTVGDLRPQHVVRTLATPFFTIPHTKQYDFDAKSFTVLALVSPDTTVESPDKPTSPALSTGEIQTGTIASMYSPCQQEVGGWTLSLTADRPKWLQARIDELSKDSAKNAAEIEKLRADYYLSFIVYGKPASFQEMLVPLDDTYYVKKKHDKKDNDEAEKQRAGKIFKRFTHLIAVVRDESGTYNLYLNGVKLDLVKNDQGAGVVNVTNNQPLNIGKISSTATSDLKQMGIVRKAALWNTALSQEQIVKQMNTMSDPKPDAGCVGYWDLWQLTYDDAASQAVSTEKNVGNDASTTKNNLPDDQRMTLSELYTVLPFFMEEQEQDVWCWNASAVSVKNFYEPHQTITQCQFVEKMFKEDDRIWKQHDGLKKPDPSDTETDPTKVRRLQEPVDLVSNVKKGTESCCDDANPCKCNYGYVSFMALEIYGMRGTFMKPISQEMSTYRQEFNCWRPICIDVPGHALAISGIYIDGQKKKWVITNDPWSGINELPFESFLTGYEPNRSWADMNLTKPC